MAQSVRSYVAAVVDGNVNAVLGPTSGSAVATVDARRSLPSSYAAVAVWLS